MTLRWSGNERFLTTFFQCAKIFKSVVLQGQYLPKNSKQRCSRTLTVSSQFYPSAKQLFSFSAINSSALQSSLHFFVASARPRILASASFPTISEFCFINSAYIAYVQLHQINGLVHVKRLCGGVQQVSHRGVLDAEQKRSRLHRQTLPRIKAPKSPMKIFLRAPPKAFKHRFCQSENGRPTDAHRHPGWADPACKYPGLSSIAAQMGNRLSHPAERAARLPV